MILTEPMVLPLHKCVCVCVRVVGSPTLEVPPSFNYEKVTTSKSQDSNGQRKQTKKVGISMERTEFLY